MFGFGLSLPKQNALFGGASFNPLTIASMTEWFDYRTLASVGDGNPISSWAGSKGLYTLTQSGTARPTYAANDGDGRAAAQFDGVNDEIGCNIDNYTLFGASGNFEQWGVIKGLSSGAGTRGPWSSGGNTNKNTVLAQTNPRILWYLPAGGDLAISGPVDLQDNVWHVVRLVRNGGNRLFYVDGVLVSTSTGLSSSWLNGPDNFIIGSAEGSYWLGSERHLLVFNSLLDDATATKLTTYLAAA